MRANIEKTEARYTLGKEVKDQSVDLEGLSYINTGIMNSTNSL